MHKIRDTQFKRQITLRTLHFKTIIITTCIKLLMPPVIYKIPYLLDGWVGGWASVNCSKPATRVVSCGFYMALYTLLADVQVWSVCHNWLELSERIIP